MDGTDKTMCSVAVLFTLLGSLFFVRWRFLFLFECVGGGLDIEHRLSSEKEDFFFGHQLIRFPHMDVGSHEDLKRKFHLELERLAFFIVARRKQRVWE